MGRRLKILGLGLAAAGLVAMTLAASASACSCAGRPGKDVFRTTDAAVIAKLIRIDPVGEESFVSDYVFRIRASFKRTGRYEPGQTRTIRAGTIGASCGLGRRVGKVTGIYLTRDPSGRLTSNLCLTTTPARIRHTAEAVSGGEKLASGPAGGAPCAAAA